MLERFARLIRVLPRAAARQRERLLLGTRRVGEREPGPDVRLVCKVLADPAGFADEDAGGRPDKKVGLRGERAFRGDLVDGHHDREDVLLGVMRDFGLQAFQVAHSRQVLFCQDAVDAVVGGLERGDVLARLGRMGGGPAAGVEFGPQLPGLVLDAVQGVEQLFAGEAVEALGCRKPRVFGWCGRLVRTNARQLRSLQ